MKSQRNYTMTIEKRRSKGDVLDGIEIKYPLTVDFNILRDLYSFDSKASFKIYNLNAATQAFLYHDKYDFTNVKRISFSAGYNNSLSVIYTGNVWEGSSVRNSVDFITSLDCSDSIFDVRTAMSGLTIKGQTTATDVADKLTADLGSLQKGYYTQSSRVYKRGYVYQGATIEGIKTVTEGKAFSDNGQIHILNANEAFSGEIYIIDAETGLIDTPIRREQMIELQMIFEPRIRVGQVLELRSLTSIYSGQYKVANVTHRGVISDGMAGSAITKLSLFLGYESLRVVE
jgi:hypothetical protein